jgi:acyl-CoA synthetase (AMP-forming)/AMP-acid ligase II
MYLTQGLHRALQQQPSGIATIFGDRVRTFAEQAGRVSRLAGELQSLGVARDNRLAYLGLNSDCFIEYYLAVPWADAVVNPVNIRWSPGEIAYMLADSGTRVLFVDDPFLAVLPAVRERYDGLDTVIHVGNGDTPTDLLPYEQLVANGPAIDDARRGTDALAGISTPAAGQAFPKVSCCRTPTC